MSRTQKQKKQERTAMSGMERLTLRVSGMINHPIAQDQRWVRIPRSSGHPFHKHLTTDSTVIRPPIPRVSDH
jgi:hypothetical protein